MKVLGALLILLAVLGGSPTAEAQMFRWTDEQGQVHYSEGLDSVPEQFRSTAAPLPYQTTPPPPPTPGKKALSRSRGTKIPFTPGSPILVSAKVNGSGPLMLLLDTGADRTVIAPLALWRLGVSTWFAPRAEVRGATGTARVDVVRVESIEVGEARAGPLVILAYDVEVKDADGLLGRDFLNRFNLNIDTAAGVVTLTPR